MATLPGPPHDQSLDPLTSTAQTGFENFSAPLKGEFKVSSTNKFRNELIDF
jgi:hypothetical protein